jgi:omega-6 fatty acid desaturase (delta-12 desaturase)
MTGCLFVVGHDCAHQSFTRYRRLNRWIGRLAFLPCLHPFSTWDLGHNKIHHRFTNQRGRDYVWEPISLKEYQALRWMSRIRYRFYRTAIGHLFYNLDDIWWRHHFFPRSSVVGKWKSEYVIDHLIVSLWLLAFVSAQAIFLHWSGFAFGIRLAIRLAEILVFTFVIPFMFFQALFSSVTYLHHTHPNVKWRVASDDVGWFEAQMANTVHVIFPGPINFIFHMIMEHTAHHLRPGIPMYNLKKAQRILEDRHASVIVYRWSLGSHLDTLRRCKLFDVEAITWTDYEGRPT